MRESRAVEADRRHALLTAKLTALVTAGWGAAEPDAPAASAVPFPGGAGPAGGDDGLAAGRGGARPRARARAALGRSCGGRPAAPAGGGRGGPAGPPGDGVRPGTPRSGRCGAAPSPAPRPSRWARRRGWTREASAWADRLRAAGAEPVVEGGVLTGEVLGLEVARVVTDAEGSRLEVGVGKHDRHAQRIMGGDVPTARGAGGRGGRGPRAPPRRRPPPSAEPARLRTLAARARGGPARARRRRPPRARAVAHRARRPPPARPAPAAGVDDAGPAAARRVLDRDRPRPGAHRRRCPPGRRSRAASGARRPRARRPPGAPVAQRRCSSSRPRCGRCPTTGVPWRHYPENVLDRLAALEKEYDEVLARLADHEVIADPRALLEASRRHKELEPVVLAYRDYRQARDDLEAARGCSPTPPATTATSCAPRSTRPRRPSPGSRRSCACSSCPRTPTRART